MCFLKSMVLLALGLAPTLLMVAVAHLESREARSQEGACSRDIAGLVRVLGQVRVGAQACTYT